MPAGNPAAAAALLRLEALNGRADLREKAEDTLEAFAGVVSHFGLYAGTYGLALERLLLPPVQIVVIGEDAAADELEAAATVGYAVNKSVIRLSRGPGCGFIAAAAGGNLASSASIWIANRAFAVVCKGTSCLPPVFCAREVA